jgi:acetate kinase
VLSFALCAALCGTNNFGTITSRAFPSGDDDQPTEEEFQSARLTYELYLDHLLSFLSSYITSVFSSRTNSTLDGLVFSGGIGERSVRLRKDVVEHFRWIEELAGTQGGIDDEKNAEGKSGRREITKRGSKVRAWVVETSEEDEMIRMSEEELAKAGR